MVAGPTLNTWLGHSATDYTLLMCCQFSHRGKFYLLDFLNIAQPLLVLRPGLTIERIRRSSGRLTLAERLMCHGTLWRS